MKFFILKHWWEILYKPMVFLLTYLVVLATIGNIFKINTEGMGSDGINLTFFIFLFSFVEYSLRVFSLYKHKRK